MSQPPGILQVQAAHSELGDRVDRLTSNRTLSRLICRMLRKFAGVTSRTLCTRTIDACRTAGVESSYQTGTYGGMGKIEPVCGCGIGGEESGGGRCHWGMCDQGPGRLRRSRLPHPDGRYSGVARRYRRWQRRGSRHEGGRDFSKAGRRPVMYEPMPKRCGLYY